MSFISNIAAILLVAGVVFWRLRVFAGVALPASMFSSSRIRHPDGAGAVAEQPHSGNSSLAAVAGKVRGFTMVELVATIMITGILAALIAPRFVDHNAFESRGFYDQVISTLRYAQKAAIAQNRFVCVAFAANSVTLTYDPVPASVAHTAMTACPGGSALAGLDMSGQSYKVSSSNTSFSPMPSPAAFYFDALGKPGISTRLTINIATVATPIYVETETGYVH